MFKLTSENLTNLGGPMGTEFTFPNWVSYHSTLAKAKAKAEADYDGNEKIKWIKETNYIHTQDLSYVMYNIEEVKQED